MPTNLAYLDPGSAGIILQMLVGGIAAGALSIKLFWRRILRVLRIRKAPASTPPTDRVADEGTPRG